jgi:hypothetical protein
MAALFAEHGLLSIIRLAIWAVQGSFASSLKISPRGILCKVLAGLLVVGSRETRTNQYVGEVTDIEKSR